MSDLSFEDEVKWSEAGKQGKAQAFKALMEREQINELVERFYARLMQEPYYIKMFAERKVDLDLLKERQRIFIARLANAGPLNEDHGEVAQTQERHKFGINPERAEAWLNLMIETMEGMGLAQDIKSLLIEKMRFLINKMAVKASESTKP